MITTTRYAIILTTFIRNSIFVEVAVAKKHFDGGCFDEGGAFSMVAFSSPLSAVASLFLFFSPSKKDAC